MTYHSSSTACNRAAPAGGHCSRHSPDNTLLNQGVLGHRHRRFADRLYDVTHRICGTAYCVGDIAEAK